MAKVIVRRPRVKWFGDAIRGRHILIDGKRVAAIGEGRTVEIELPPGGQPMSARAESLGSQPVEIARPFHGRSTIGTIMIVVALLAFFLGTAIELTRRRSSEDFRSKARQHAASEVQYRKIEWSCLQSASNRGFALGARYRQRAARADYHAAMKRKYEDAAAERWFTVEPDPAEPPWP